MFFLFLCLIFLHHDTHINIHAMVISFKSYSLKPLEIQTYLFSSIFIIGNILLPQLAHLLPNGGLVLLPIYFFTLIAAYKYGLYLGIFTALASPLANHLLFGMPSHEILPILIIKALFLVVAASYVAKKSKELSLLNLLMVILFYQGLGVIAEFLLSNSWTQAFQDLVLGYPGLLFQLVGGYFLLRVMRNW